MVRKRGRSALASVYGFIVIYLLAIASLQAISLAVSGSEEADQAAQRAQQVDQERSVERLQVSLSGGNLTITNDGLIPSMVSSILVQNSTFSMDVEFQDSLGVGASVTESLGAAISSPSAAAVVTTLGNVFEASRAPAPAGGFNVIGGTVGGPNLDAQIYQNPSDPSRLFLAVGSSVYALSTSTGKETWSFNASQGEITDVLPLSSGDVYVSDGYFGNQFTSNLFHLNSAGASLAAYSMRLFKLWTTLGSDIPPWPFGSQPVDKGADSLYAYYDGWFFSSAGASTTILAGDSYFLAAEDSDQFYALELSPNPGGYGCSGTHGNFATVYAYSADSRGVIQEWSTMAFLNSCDYYLNAVVSASSNSGTLALLLSQVYWSTTTYYGGPYQGANPYLVVLSTSGTQLRGGTMDASGYTSVATDGSQVFLAIPSQDEVEVVGSTGSGAGAFYNVGISGSSLEWAENSLFVISPDEVKVYTASMTLEKTIEFSPDSFYSATNSKQMEPQMVSPSFIVLNSTSYAALLRNSSGFGTLAVGGY